MNTQINLLSDDALDAVSGGRPHLVSEGNVPIPGSTLATGSQGDMGTGESFLQGLKGVLGLTAQGAILGFAAIPVTGFGLTVI